MQFDDDALDPGDDPQDDPTKPAWAKDPRISGNVAKMRAQGASETEVQDYLTRVEKIGAPAANSPAPAGPDPAPGTRSPGATPMASDMTAVRSTAGASDLCRPDRRAADRRPASAAARPTDVLRNVLGQGLMMGVGR